MHVARRFRRFAITLTAWFVLAAVGGFPARAADTAAIHEGAGRFLFHDPETATGKTLRVWYYRPKAFGPETPIVFVMHGVGRNARGYRDNWIELAERHVLLIVAPEFSKKNFPKSWAYAFGNVMARENGKTLVPNPERKWSFHIVDRIFDAVRDAAGSRRTTFTLFGHSAGAQFVHRYMTFTGGPRVDLAIAANAGWYTMPVEDEKFPYGLRGTELSEGSLGAVFARRIVILLGEADVTQDRPFRTTPGAMRQGASRLARGKFYFATAQGVAAKLGVPFNWRLEFVPGVAHDNAGMAVGAARIIAESVPGAR